MDESWPSRRIPLWSLTPLNFIPLKQESPSHMQYNRRFPRITFHRDLQWSQHVKEKNLNEARWKLSLSKLLPE